MSFAALAGTEFVGNRCEAADKARPFWVFQMFTESSLVLFGTCNVRIEDQIRAAVLSGLLKA